MHLLAQLQIKRAERFVEQKHLGLVGQGAGDRHTLALAAGELSGAAGAVAGQLDHGERVLGSLAAFLAADALDHQPVGDVVEDREMREEGVVLKHRVDATPIGRHALGRLAEDLDMAAGRLLEAGHQAETRGLARAGGTEHGEEFALGDFEVHAIDGAHGAEVAGNIVEENGGGH
ncbi:hypothetical protein D9M72_538370 [compost metagenome]